MPLITLGLSLNANRYKMYSKLRQQLEREITVSAELMQQLEARGVILKFHKNDYVLKAG